MSTYAYPQSHVGAPMDGVAVESTGASEAYLSEVSTDAIGAGYGITEAAGATLNWRPEIELATETGAFKGIVPSMAIPTPEVSALKGTAVDTVPPGESFAPITKGRVRVPLVNGPATPGDQAYLVYSGADRGKWDVSTNGASEITTLTFGAGGGGGTGGCDFDGLSVVSVADQGTDPGNAAAWALFFGAHADYAPLVASVTVNGADVIIAWADEIAHTFNDASVTVTLGAAQTQAPSASTARAISGAVYKLSTAATAVLEIS